MGSSSDSFNRAFLAQKTGERPKVSDERFSEIRKEIDVLRAGISSLPVDDQIERYERILMLGGERGYVSSPDPVDEAEAVSVIHDILQLLHRGELPDDGKFRLRSDF